MAYIYANSQAFAAMTNNPNAYAKLAQSQNQLAIFSANSRAFEALWRNPNFAALAMNTSYAAALQSGAVQASFGARGSGDDR